MTHFTHKRLCVATLFWALLLVSANSAAGGENWPGWMGGPKNSNEYESQLSMARLNERHGQHEAAMKIYNAVLEKQPKNQMAHHRLAIIAATNGEYTTADQHFSNALKSGPRTPDLMCDVGYCLFLQNRLDEAEEALRRILAESPTHKKAHNTLGMVLGLKGRYEESLNEFRQVVGEAEAHANLAFVLVQVGDLEQSNKHYHEAVRLNPALRPAVEALIQLNEQSSSAAAKATANAASSASKASPTTPAATITPISMAKPASAKTSGIALKQPTSLEASTFTTNAKQAQNQPELITIGERSSISQQTSDTRSELAKQLTPQTPVVPTLSKDSFAPAILGLARKERVSPGIKASSSAHGNMMTKHNQIEQPESIAEVPTTNSKTGSPTAEFADAPIPSPAQQQPSIATLNADKPADPSRLSKITKAQVINYAPSQMSQVSVIEDASPINSMPSIVEISDDSAESEEVGEVVMTPRSDALAAARAQADLLTHTMSNDSAAQSSQAVRIPVDISAANTVSPATFAVSDESMPMKASAETSAIKTNDDASAATHANPSPAVGQPTPAWHVVLMTLGGVFAVVLLRNTAKRLGRRKASLEPELAEVARVAEVAEVPQVCEIVEAQVSAPVSSVNYDAEERYSYLESQIRDVCAGLRSGRRSADEMRLV